MAERKGGTKLKLGVLISGRGSNLQALIDASANPDYPAEIALVVSNVPNAKGLERCRQPNIATAVIDHKDFDDRESFEAELDKTLRANGVGLVCLAGFMRLLTDTFVNRWHNRLINIHPSLLPAFKGINVHERAVEAGVRIAGCTVHYVRPAMDDGPIIVQAAVPVHPNDDADTLAARVLTHEHLIYPLVVSLIAEGRVRVAGERVLIDDVHSSEESLINPVDRR